MLTKSNCIQNSVSKSYGTGYTTRGKKITIPFLIT